MKRMILFLVVIFSLVMGNSVEYKCNILNNSFVELERHVLENYDFVQNGIKFEYMTKVGIEEEKERLISLLTDNIDDEVAITPDGITTNRDDLTFSISVYGDKMTRVSITLLNENSNFDTEKLRQVVEKFRNENCTSDRYFTFLKGKLTVESDESLNFIKSQLNEDSFESIKINNGEVCKGKLSDGELVNVGRIHYNTGDYIIIGTPIIFVTY